MHDLQLKNMDLRKYQTQLTAKVNELAKKNLDLTKKVAALE